VFRYSARPLTAAMRMAGQVAEPVKKARSAELLAFAAEARAAFAREHVGREVRVLLESRLADDRWLGHAEDHVLVAVDGRELENAVALVRAERVDRAAPDRLEGRILAVDVPRRITRGLPVLDAAGAWAS
jgi:tRNA A37 methylthiotransferase MiaB